MQKDAGWSIYLSDDERYADLINGCVYGGINVVESEYVCELDTKMWLQNITGGKKRYISKTRDILSEA
jgi:hypothetical protein